MSRQQRQRQQNYRGNQQLNYPPQQMQMMAQPHQMQPMHYVQPYIQFMPSQMPMNVMQPSRQQSGGIYQKQRNLNQQKGMMRQQQMVQDIQSQPIESRISRPQAQQRRNVQNSNKHNQRSNNIEDRLILPNRQNQQWEQQVNYIQQNNRGKTLKLNPNSKKIQKQKSQGSHQSQKQSNLKKQGSGQQNQRSEQQKQQSQAHKSILKNANQQSYKPVANSGNDGLAVLKGPVILPIQNPTGNPYHQKGANLQTMLQKIQDVNELKGLQVKAELNKLADPTPGFASLLMMENKAEQVDGDQMQDSESLIGQKSKTIGELFSKIQYARPALNHKTIELARRVQSLQKQGASPNSGASNSNLQQDLNPEKKDKQSRPNLVVTTAKSRLQQRKNNLDKAKNPRKYYRPKV